MTKILSIILVLICLNSCVNNSKSNITENDFQDYRNSQSISVTLENEICVYAEKIDGDYAIIYLTSDDETIDSFRVESNNTIEKLYKSRNDSIVYLLSYGGSASCGMVTRINILTKTYSFNDYEAWGYSGCKQIGDYYVISCKTNPMHSDELISYQWTDTLNSDFELIHSSDTIEIQCE